MLDVAGYCLTFTGQPKNALPDWLGSTWRGAMGHALKSANCNCQQPKHRPDCVYSQIFETPVPPSATRLRRYPAAPHPYILRPQPHDPAQPEHLVLHALLLGSAREHSRALLNALSTAAANGLGASRTPYKLVATNHISLGLKPQIKPNTTTLDITLITPHLVKYRGQIMTPQRFDLKGWLTTLMRRYNSLQYFHGHGQEPSNDDVQRLLNAFAQASLLSSDLNWRHVKRHSSRQQKNIDQSGLQGAIRVDLGKGRDDILPLLVAGTTTHVGKSTVMGHGQYQLQAAP